MLLILAITANALCAGIPALRPPALQRLDVGAIKPLGWLKDELSLQAKGLSGQLPYFWGYFNNSAWMKEHTDNGGQPHQFIPYYLNGLIPLSYQVHDDNLVALRDRYVEFILGHQNITSGPDGPYGWLGPDIPRHEDVNEHDPPAVNYWSKYLAVEAFESYAEAAPSQKERVVAALLAHHRAFYLQLSQNDPPLNISRWGFARSEDGLAGIQWLLDHGPSTQAWFSGEAKAESESESEAEAVAGAGTSMSDKNSNSYSPAFLWDLLHLLKNGTDAIMRGVSAAQGGSYNWEEWFESGDPFAPHNDREATGTVHLQRHGVDIGQAMKMGALWWRVVGKLASERGRERKREGV
jgi:hypothetical protein